MNGLLSSRVSFQAPDKDKALEEEELKVKTIEREMMEKNVLRTGGGGGGGGGKMTQVRVGMG